jgi:predicted MPP superfamily phosphohydrolase
METVRQKFPFDFVITLGDNLYGSQRPADFVTKFEKPYKGLLDAGVKFYASLGNHDEPGNKFYKLWNMNGQNYYAFARKNVRFFALDSDYMDAKQLRWLEEELRASKEAWKIAYFHHPLYSSAGRHGSEVDLRVLLEPLFIKYGVNVVFSGHDHTYERIKPQKGIYYFVEGASGQLRTGDLHRSELTAAGYDQDRTFIIAEIDGETLWFQVISRTGQSVDSGSVRLEKPNRSTGASQGTPAAAAASPGGR